MPSSFGSSCDPAPAQLPARGGIRLSGVLRFVESCITALGEMRKSVPRAQLREAHADRRSLPGLLDRRCYRLKSPASVLGHAVPQRADELVTPDSDDRIIGAQVHSDRGDHVSQQLVTCGMAFAVVDLFEPVDVDVGEHEASVSALSSVDLAVERDHSKLASEGAGELIDLRASQLASRPLAIARSADAICGGLVAVGYRLLTVAGSLVSIAGPLLGVDLGQIAIRRRVIAVGGRVIAVGGGLISSEGPLLGLDFRPIAVGLRTIAVASGLVLAKGPFVCLDLRPIAIIGGAIAIGGRSRASSAGLVSAKGPLVGIRLGLSTAGGGAIAAGGGAIAAGGGLTRDRRGLGSGELPLGVEDLEECREDL